MSDLPADYKYTKTHEWVRVEEDGTITIGITDHAQGLLGDLVYVRLPEVGQIIDTQEECVVLESVKTAEEVYSPISGEVVAINEVLEEEPELINQGAFEQGWIYKVQPSNDADMDELLSVEDYQAMIEQEDD